MARHLIKYDWLMVLILFLASELIVCPAGEFPLNDDWAYAKAVDSYLTKGTVQFSFWQAIPGLPQYFIGILSGKLFGFSFTTLRLVTITCMVTMIFIFNAGLKQLKINSFSKFAALLLFAFNPLAFSLGNTFMPDIFTLFFALISFQFILLYFKSNKILWIWLFIATSVLCTLSRQTGLIVPLCFGLIFFYISPKSKKNILVSLVPFAANCAALFFYEQLSKHCNVLPANYNLQLNGLIGFFCHPAISKIRVATYYFITSSVCLGLFILPLFASNVKFYYSALKHSIVFKSTLVIYLTLLILKLCFSGNIFPFAGNMFYHLGIGPVILTGFNTDATPVMSFFTKSAWIILNITGGLSFIGAVTAIWLKLKVSGKSAAVFCPSFFLVLLIFYLLPVSVNYANDRYLLFLLPFFILAYITSIPAEWNKIIFLSLFIPLIYFSVAATHDYLSVNRAKWHAADHLVKDLKIDPLKIDGGFEFNGWYLGGTKNYNPAHTGRWWWIEGDDYIISPAEIKGYKIESAHEFQSWLSFKFNKIYVWKKQ